MTQQVKRSRRKSAELRRQDLVAAAMEVISRHGVAKLTTRTLSEAVGVAQPTLFLHFGSKSALLVALVDAIQARLKEGLAGLAMDRLSPAERLQTVIRFHLAFIQQQPGIPRLLFSEELQSGDPQFRDRMGRLVGDFLSFMAGLIRAGQAAGEIRGDIDPEQNACFLISAIQGLAFRWILSDNRFVLAEQAEPLISAILDGWRPRPDPAVRP